MLERVANRERERERGGGGERERERESNYAMRAIAVACQTLAYSS